MHLTQIYIRTVACKMCLEMSSCAWWHLGCSMFNVHILYECQNHLTKYYRWIVTMNIVFRVASFGLWVLNAFYRWWWFRAINSNKPERIRELTYRMHWMPQNNSTGMRCAMCIQCIDMIRHEPCAVFTESMWMPNKFRNDVPKWQSVHSKNNKWLLNECM